MTKEEKKSYLPKNYLLFRFNPIFIRKKELRHNSILGFIFIWPRMRRN